MNFRRILMVSSCHLLKRVCTTTVAAPTRVQNSYLGMRTCTTSVAAPSTSNGCSASGLKDKEEAKRQKKKLMMEELMDVSETGGIVEKTLDAFTMKEKEDGVSITKADLVSWSILIDRAGRPEISCQIFEWMEKKNMKFSPSQLAHFVDFIDRVHGIRAALDYFEYVDPDFDNMDYNAKNWPAYDFLARSMSRNWNKRPW